MTAAAAPIRPRLNPAQARAVAHGEGPLLVLAGAGTGKTRVIVQRIARLLEAGEPAEGVLALTFTHKAALQMRARLVAMLGQRATGLTLSTFHALGLSILKAEPAAVGLRPGFAIYDTHDQLSLVRELMRQVKVADRRLDPQRVLEIIAAGKRQGRASIELRWGDDYELAAYDLYPRYLEQMRAFNAIDFDDLITGSSRALAQPEPRARWAGRWRWLLVDEYQDTSAAQLEMVRALAAPHHNVFAVGDDDQSIYAWRGAAVDNIFDFGRHFPGTAEVTLEENYRSTGHILAAANQVVALNPSRRLKTLRAAGGLGEPVEVISCIDAQDEAACVAELVGEREVASGRGGPGSCAVLTRARATQEALEEALVQANIPHRVVGGQAFYDRKEVRDVLALMALAHDPGDEGALRRIINVPSRGLGPKSVEALAGWAEHRRLPLLAAMAAVAASSPSAAGLELTPAARQGAGQFIAATAGAGALAAARGSACEPALRALVDALGLKDAIAAGGDAAGMTARRQDSLEAIIVSWGRFAGRHRGRGAPLGAFVGAHRRRQAASADEQGDGGVVVMTLHAAKGLEFDMVVMAGVEEDLLPHKKTLEEGGSIEEERRLCHVGMTRARRRLVLTHARTRGSVGRASPRTPSRFLDALPAPPGVVRRERREDDDERVARADAAAQDFFAQMQAKLGLAAATPVRGGARSRGGAR